MTLFRKKFICDTTSVRYVGRKSRIGCTINHYEGYYEGQMRVLMWSLLLNSYAYWMEDIECCVVELDKSKQLTVGKRTRYAEV